MNKDLFAKKIDECINPKERWQVLDKKYDLDVAMWIEKDELHINFKGSDSKIDWKINFSFWKRPYKNMDKLMFVHSGFIRAYQSGRDAIHHYYLNNKVNKIVVRGYSLGCVLARHCYEDFFWHRENDEAYKHLELDGFGMGGPRNVSVIGAKEFNRRLEGFERLMNNSDLVPRLPPFVFGYAHTGKGYQLGKKSLWPITAKSIYQHWYKSYLGHLLDKDFKDTIENNKLVEPAKKVFVYIKLGLSAIMILAAVLLWLI